MIACAVSSVILQHVAAPVVLATHDARLAAAARAQGLETVGS